MSKNKSKQHGIAADVLTKPIFVLLGLCFGLALAPGAAADTAPSYPNGPIFGLAGMTANQSFRLNFTNDASAGSAQCRAAVTLVDASNTAFGTASTVIGASQTSQLQPADMSYGDNVICFGDAGLCLPSAAAAVTTNPPTPPHALFRPVITLTTQTPGVSLNQACGRVSSWFELADPVTGRIEVIWPADPIHPRNPILATLQSLYPNDPIKQLIGVTGDDVLRVSLVNANQNPASAGCPVRIGVQTDTGAVVQQQSLTLGPGQSVSVAQAGGLPGGGVLNLRPITAFATDPIGGVPCRGVTPTVEVVDIATQKTRVFIPADTIGSRIRLGF